MLTGKRLSYLLISGLLLLLIACSSSNEIKPADSVASLEQALKDAGMRVEGPNENDFLSARFFSIPGVQFNGFKGNEDRIARASNEQPWARISILFESFDCRTTTSAANSRVLEGVE